MFVHTVYFWLKADLTAEQTAEFVKRCTALTGIAAVKHGWVGVPADTDRPVIDRTYTYGLALVFDDKAAHDVYQVDAIHAHFLELKDSWTQVKIYDFEG
jgi:hypothetical protein